MDREELKAEVDAYMQDYDKKIAEVRSGWGGNPAKQLVWGEEREKIFWCPGLSGKSKGKHTGWQGCFTPSCWWAVRSWFGPHHLTLPPRAYNRYPQINQILAGVQCCDCELHACALGPMPAFKSCAEVGATVALYVFKGDCLH